MTQLSNPISFKDTELLKPIKLGKIELSHRVVLSPLTRLRNDPETFIANVDLLKEYYSQRSKRPGSLVITEGVNTEFGSVGFFPGVSGIWTAEQTSAWKEIIDAVHANHSFVVVQLYHFGRLAHPKVLKELGLPYVAPSPIYIKENPNYPNFEKDSIESGTPLRELTIDEISDILDNFVNAAKNSINSAGADGVQIHVANGYLLNQFLDPESNQRADKYGGSIENRSRLILELIDRLDEEFNGLDKVSVRISPFGIYGGLKGAGGDPLLLAQYAHLVGELELRRQQGKALQFLEVIQPRYSLKSKDEDDDVLGLRKIQGSNEFVSTIWKGKLISNGNLGNDQSLILKEIEDGRTLISIGRNYISNPDLPDRLENGWPLSRYDRDTFYEGGAKGYIDYPRYEKN
jgi:NADPH2 dehydrogenase